MKRLHVILIFVALAIVLFCVTVRAFSIESVNTFDAPGSGVGRVQTPVVRYTAQTCVETCVETGIDTPETETPENEPYIASETASVNYESSTETLAVEEETWVEVIPEADPIIYTDIDALIVQVAAEYGLPWELVRAVCWVESGFDTNAISSTGDYGIMQVSYINHGWLGLDNPLDPEANLRAGCQILKDAIDASGGDFTLALMRYNRGDAYAREQWSRGIFSTDYTNRVLTKYYEYLAGGY